MSSKIRSTIGGNRRRLAASAVAAVLAAGGIGAIAVGGAFDESEGSYVDDTVVYAHLTSSHPA